MRPAARALILQRDARMLLAVGTAHDEGQRRGNGAGLVIAQQRGQINRFAGAIDAALGEHHRIERPRRRPPADTAVGQVEGLAREIEEAVIAFRRARDDDRRADTPPSPRVKPGSNFA